jgi:signal transduction histidine kinase
MSLARRLTLFLLGALAALVAVAWIGLEVSIRRQVATESERWESSRETEWSLRLDNQALSSTRSLLQLGSSSATEDWASIAVSGTSRFVVDWAGSIATEYDLDQVVIFDAAGNIRSSALLPEAYGQQLPAAEFLRTSFARQPVYWRAWGATEDLRCIGSVMRIAVGDEHWWIAGGNLLDDALLDRLALEVGVASYAWTQADQPNALELPAGWQLETRDAFELAATSSPGIEALLALRQKLRAPIALLGLLVLLVVPPTLWRLLRPLRELSSMTKSIAAGERDFELNGRGPSEVVELERSLVGMAAELGRVESRMRSAERRGAWREIAQRIAHEIKNALSPLRLAVDNVETAVGRDDDAGRRALARSLSTAREQLVSLDRLVSEFRSFARTPELSLGSLDPRALLEGARDAAARIFTGQEFRIIEGPTLGEIRGDPEQLRRALVNLLINAAEAVPGGVVELAFGGREGENFWWIRVRDEGQGPSAEMLEHFGEPYRSSKPQGTGLGVAVVMQIAAAHGGSLTPRRRENGFEMLLELDRYPQPLIRNEVEE